MRDIDLSDGLRYHRLLKKPSEYQAPAPGSAPVEPEGELLQVGLQMNWNDGTLMGPKNPPFQQTRNSMDTRHGDMGGVAGRRQTLIHHQTN